MSLFDRLRTALRRTELRHLTLSFEFGRSDDERHLVRVSKVVDGISTPVEDLRQLAQYGYREEETATDGHLIIYTLKDSDRQLLLGLASMNPDILPDKRLAFPMFPPLLRFARTKANVAETKNSSRLTIDRKPLKPIAKIDFSQEDGLTVETGYSIPGQAELVPYADLAITHDGNYVQVGDNLAPVDQLQDQRVRAWLEKPRKVFHGDEIPEFFGRDYVLLRSHFSAVLTGQAQQIEVLDAPFRPFVKLDMSVPGWLDYNVGYDVGDFRLDHATLMSVAGSYFQVNGSTWIRHKPATVNATENRLRSRDDIATESGYRVPVSEFLDIEDFIASMGRSRN